MSAVNNIIEALGGRTYLKRLGAEIVHQGKKPQVVIKWSAERSPNGVTWCVITMHHTRCILQLGDDSEVRLEESDLAVSEAARLFWQACCLPGPSTPVTQ